MASQARPGDPGSFRDSVSTISKEGNRAWIYPQKPKGPLYNKRTWVSIILLTFLFGTPFIKVNGHPLMLFNIIERKFILFGIPFWPQDFFLFVLAIAAFGRECTRRGVPPPTVSLFGSQFLTWRGIPLIPSDKVAVQDGKTKVLLVSLKIAPPNLARLPLKVLLFANRLPRLRTAPPLMPQAQLS